ncbi:MAG: hypothetical protein H6739_36845 [Alphaproteobacteria bacterium]|nr:hypothetical protein [Alphaproteobacteria bacterium]
MDDPLPRLPTGHLVQGVDEQPVAADAQAGPQAVKVHRDPSGSLDLVRYSQGQPIDPLTLCKAPGQGAGLQEYGDRSGQWTLGQPIQCQDVFGHRAGQVLGSQDCGEVLKQYGLARPCLTLDHTSLQNGFAKSFFRGRPSMSSLFDYPRLEQFAYNRDILLRIDKMQLSHQWNVKRHPIQPLAASDCGQPGMPSLGPQTKALGQQGALGLIQHG